MTERIEAQIERFAPGFRDLILARSAPPPAESRRTTRTTSAATSLPARTRPPDDLPPDARAAPLPDAVAGLYLCSASTPPGGGVHGMCGMRAALAALGDLEGARAA